MTNNLHIMIDIETLGTTAGCIITDIAAIAFDPLGEHEDVPHDSHTFKSVVSIQSCAMAGLRPDGSTLRWRDEKKLEHCEQTAEPLHKALAGLSDFIHRIRPEKLWAHGKDFDFNILAAAYRALNDKAPWEYRDLKCSRDLISDIMGDDVTMTDIIGKSNNHNALMDAYNQARAVQIVTQKQAAMRIAISDTCAENIRLTQRIAELAKQLDEVSQHAECFEAEALQLRGP